MQLRKPLCILAFITCVILASSAEAAYIDNGDGTITDTGTGLMWQQATAPGTYTWEQSLAYCENLSLAGYSDWRLPTAKELGSLDDKNRANPAINTSFFPDTTANYYWSSTTDAISGGAWGVYFDSGEVYSNSKSGARYVRAVRLGQAGAFAAVALWPVPDTGQTQSYTSTFGEDHDYTINPPSYTKLAAGGTALPATAANWDMVRDEVTGLVWEEKHNRDYSQDYTNPNDADNTYTWYDGATGTPGDGTDTLDFIIGLNESMYGGYSDWRMPTNKELLSIVNYGRYNPAINTTYFPNTVATYWSSVTYTGSSDAAWNVYFYYGQESSGCKKDLFLARAVRVGAVETTTTTTTASPEADFLYSVSAGIVTIIGYTGTGGVVAIPKTIAGMPVVHIGGSAFMHRSSITSITIPDSVTSIGDDAFNSCSRLTSLTIPNSVTIIGNYAFAYTGLTTITIPGSVRIIENGAFMECYALNSITLLNGVTTIGDNVFYDCARLINITIPNSAAIFS